MKKRLQESEVVDFDEFVKGVQQEDPIKVFFGKRYPEDKRCNIDAFVAELQRRLEHDDKRVYFISIALITDYCREKLIERFKDITGSVHIILCLSKEKLLTE